MTRKYLMTKYGSVIPDDVLIQYFERMINRIYKILPLKEEEMCTLTIYIQYLTIELNSGKKLMIRDVGFYDLLINLESLFDVSLEHSIYRSQVFKCIEVCQQIITKLREGDDADGI